MTVISKKNIVKCYVATFICFVAKNVRTFECSNISDFYYYIFFHSKFAPGETAPATPPMHLPKPFPSSLLVCKNNCDYFCYMSVSGGLFLLPKEFLLPLETISYRLNRVKLRK